METGIFGLHSTLERPLAHGQLLGGGLYRGKTARQAFEECGSNPLNGSIARPDPAATVRFGDQVFAQFRMRSAEANRPRSQL